MSGDDNPLHLDPEIAKLAGLDAPPLHGMLMMSHFEPALMTWIASWRRDVKIAKLSGKFLRPVLAGQAITISGKIVRSSLEPQPHLILRLMAHGAGRDLAILAEATLLPRGA